MAKVRIATSWLDGCSGCHMSFLDLDEQLLALADRIELVYSPLVDTKKFPDQVDVTLVEGAVSNIEDEEKIRLIRSRTKVLVSLGDCAVTSNVPAMRNPLGPGPMLQRAYIENVSHAAQLPKDDIPPLLKRVRPIHEVVHVDVFVPGCPPSAGTIGFVVTELLEGRIPDLAKQQARFG